MVSEIVVFVIEISELAMDFDFLSIQVIELSLKTVNYVHLVS